MSAEFERHLRDLLTDLGDVRLRRMFGGIGVYLDDVFMAIGIDDSLYLKTDDETRARFEAAGMTPFVYRGGAREITMSYWSVPEEAYDDPSAMRPWAQLALAAALRSAQKKSAPQARRVAAPGSRKKPAAGSRGKGAR